MRALAPFLQTAVLCVTIGGAGAARADTQSVKDACIAAHEAAQSQTRAGHLLAARRELIRCAQEQCPSVLRTECASTLERLSTSVPSVVVRARAGDVDVLEARLYIDGKPVASTLDGRAIEIDPGRHQVRIVDARARSREQTFVVLEGRKNQLVQLTFDEGRKREARTRDELAKPPYLAYGIGLLGAGAIGSFAYFGLSGKQKEQDLDGCMPNCRKSEYRAMRRDYIIADSSLAAGAVLLGISAYLFFTHEPRRSSARAWLVVPDRRGASVAYQTRF